MKTQTELETENSDLKEIIKELESAVSKISHQSMEYRELLHQSINTDGRSGGVERLTKREYFAACSLQGLGSNPGANDFSREKITEMAVDHADGLILALSKANSKEQDANDWKSKCEASNLQIQRMKKCLDDVEHQRDEWKERYMKEKLSPSKIPTEIIGPPVVRAYPTPDLPQVTEQEMNELMRPKPEYKLPPEIPTGGSEI